MDHADEAAPHDLSLTEHRQNERRLAAQLAAAQALAEAASTSDAVTRVLEAMCRTEGWQVGGLWWVDDDQQLPVMRCQAVWREAGVAADDLAEASQRAAFRPGEGLPGHVWATGETVWTEDVRLDRRFPRFPIASRDGLRSACAFPLRSGGEVLGVIEFYGSEVRPFDALLVCVMDHIGALLGQYFARRRAERDLARTERHLHAVLSHAPLLLFALDRTGRFTTLAGRALEDVAPGGRDLIGRSVFEHFAHVPELLESCRLALAGQAHGATFGAAEGRHYETSYVPLFAPGDRDTPGAVTGVIGVALDVTEHREADEALGRTEQRLVESERLAALGTMAGAVSHQISNALASVRLVLGRLVSFELAQRPFEPERLHRVELLQDVREGLGQVERVILELKAFSGLDDTPAGAVDVARPLESALRLASHDIRHRARLHCEDAAVPPVHGTEFGLRQVFLNLLMNAVQALPEGEAHLHEIRVATRTDPDGSVVVEVRDTGVGIAPEKIGRIFEPFFSTRGAGQGIGLGLSIARDIVTGFGGEIEAESAPGVGTSVRIKLRPSEQPAVTRTAEAEAGGSIAAAEDAPSTAKGRSPRARILIVDDDRPLAAAVALELGAHDVVVAESGSEALHILTRDRAFDLVLCDLMMPEVTGMALFEAFESVDPALASRFVFMTGGAFSQTARRFLSRVPNRCIDKPFDAHVLQELVARDPTDVPESSTRPAVPAKRGRDRFVE